MLNHQLLLDAESIRIYYNSADEWIYIMWIGESSLETVKFVSESVLSFLISLRCTKLLSDHRQRTGIWADTTIWTQTDWMPRAEIAGLNAVAIVYSPDLYSKLSADQLINQYKGKASALAFNNIETAESWLRSI